MTHDGKKVPRYPSTMPITTEQAVEAIRTAIESATGVTVILARYDAVRVASPYATVDEIGDDTVGYPLTTLDPFSVSAVREVRVQVTGYGATMKALLKSAAARLWSPADAVGAALIAAGVKPQRTTAVQNISGPYRTGQEPRATFDVIAQYEWVAADTDAGVDAATSIVVDTHARGSVVADAEPAIVIPEVP